MNLVLVSFFFNFMKSEQKIQKLKLKNENTKLLFKQNKNISKDKRGVRKTLGV